jgi:SAM-dependent methyltransferase
MEHHQYFKEIQDDIDLIDEPLRPWSRTYLNGHWKRYVYDFNTVKSLYSSGEILEIGSMPFHFTLLLKKAGFPVTGVDVGPGRAERLIKKNDLRVLSCDIEKEPLPFPDNSFDLIIFSEIFEHLRINPIATLKEINRVLKPEGRLLLTTPNLYALGNVWWFLTGRSIDSTPYSQYLKLEQLGHMGHVRVYSAKEVSEFLSNTGFVVDQIKYRYFGLRGKFILFNFVYRIFPGLRPHLIVIGKKNKQLTP